MRRGHQRKTKFLDANYLIGIIRCLAQATTDLHPQGAFLYGTSLELLHIPINPVLMNIDKPRRFCILLLTVDHQLFLLCVDGSPHILMSQ